MIAELNKVRRCEVISAQILIKSGQTVAKIDQDKKYGKKISFSALFAWEQGAKDVHLRPLCKRLPFDTQFCKFRR